MPGLGAIFGCQISNFVRITRSGPTFGCQIWSHFFVFLVPELGPFLVPELGPEIQPLLTIYKGPTFGPQKRSLIWSQKWNRKFTIFGSRSGPTLGPKTGTNHGPQIWDQKMDPNTGPQNCVWEPPKLIPDSGASSRPLCG